MSHSLQFIHYSVFKPKQKNQKSVCFLRFYVLKTRTEKQKNQNTKTMFFLGFSVLKTRTKKLKNTKNNILFLFLMIIIMVGHLGDVSPPTIRPSFICSSARPLRRSFISHLRAKHKMETFILFRGSRRLGFKAEDLTSEKIGMIFQVRLFYLTFASYLSEYIVTFWQCSC